MSTFANVPVTTLESVIETLEEIQKDIQLRDDDSMLDAKHDGQLNALKRVLNAELTAAKTQEAMKAF